MKKQDIKMAQNPSKIIEALNNLRDMVSDKSIKSQPKWAEENLLKLKKFVEKYGEGFQRIEEVLFELQLLEILQNPTVYVARTRDAKTDIEYFTAKTAYRLPNGKKKEVKIYLGKASDYDNNTQSKKAKSEAIWKMQQTIARRMREGSL